MKHLFLLILLVIFWMNTSFIFQEFPKTQFALRISFQASGAVAQIQVYIDNGRTHALRKSLSVHDFVYFASGEWPSIYNKQRQNFFEFNGVKGGVFKDSLTMKEYAFCPALDSVWKIRFDQFAFKEGFGWSQEKFKPSAAQMQYLFDEYGVKNLDIDAFQDTSFWKLLRDVEDENWINSYKTK